MKQILDDIENLIINSEEAAGGKEEKDDGNSGSTVQGIINDKEGGGLGTIKDEDSNADSDFSGDEGPIPQQI
jgi:hypothetical protein